MPNYVNGNAEYQVGQTAETPKPERERRGDWGRRPRGILDKLMGGHRGHGHHRRGGRGKGSILDGATPAASATTATTQTVPTNV